MPQNTRHGIRDGRHPRRSDEAHAAKCELKDLSAELRREPCALIFMDVEGAEDLLLDPMAVPALLHVEILVELHDVSVPGVTDRIQRRFASLDHLP